MSFSKKTTTSRKVGAFNVLADVHSVFVHLYWKEFV